MIDGVTARGVVLNIGVQGVLKFEGLRLTHKVDEFYDLRGSTHKVKNSGLHNADDFYFSDFKKVLNRLRDEIGLNPDIATLNGVEFGVNIKLPTNPNNVLKRIILHKSNSGCWKNNKHNYKEFGYADYSNKFYNKSELTTVEPYHSENILRIEVCVKRMRHLKGVLTYKRIADLLDVELWKRFEEILVKTVHECLVIDFSDNEINSLSKDEYIQYLKYLNPIVFWDCLDRRKFYEEKNKCEKFILKHSKSTLKIDIINMVRLKCEELRDVPCIKSNVNNSDKFHTLQNVIQSEKKDVFHCRVGVNLSKQVLPEKCGLKHCLTCGRVIPNPRVNQRFCSAKDVGYAQAHICRNKNSNPRNNARTSFQSLISIPLLFDLNEFIESDKLKFLIENPIN